MKKLDVGLAARMSWRGTVNWVKTRPICMSFELTHSCTCDCRHCDHGGIKKDNKNIYAEDYRKLARDLKPLLLQLSGGEPLLRPDLYEIISAVKEKSGLPYLIIVTNASKLDPDVYQKCIDLGVNQFSVSLDFPDDRHDDFRGYPGLYSHLEDVIPRIMAKGGNNLVMNTAITRWNLPHLVECYEKAKSWGANISFSAYTSLRTNDTEYTISSPEDLALLKDQIDRLLEIKRKGGKIINSDWTLTGTYEFFKNGGTMPGCQAGKRTLVINPDGTMRPCSMFDYRFKSHEEVMEKFVKNNTCGGCYVSIRAYLSKGYWELLYRNIMERVILPSR